MINVYRCPNCKGETFRIVKYLVGYTMFVCTNCGSIYFLHELDLESKKEDDLETNAYYKVLSVSRFK